jgi:glycine dehydrogenase subunit 2
MYQLEYLEVHTCTDDFSLQVAEGSQSDMTKAYYKEKNEGKKRTMMIIPGTAHGTNPATTAMCKFETISIPTSSRSNHHHIANSRDNNI